MLVTPALWSIQAFRHAVCIEMAIVKQYGIDSICHQPKARCWLQAILVDVIDASTVYARVSRSCNMQHGSSLRAYMENHNSNHDSKQIFFLASGVMSAAESNRIALNLMSTMLNNPPSIPETIVNELQKGVRGSPGYVFANNGDGEAVVCIYSSDRRFYTIGKCYKIDELPDGHQMDIFHRNDLIGIVSLTVDIVFEDESYEELVQNVICLALMKHGGDSQQKAHFFEKDIYKEMDRVLQSTLSDVSAISAKVNATMQSVHSHNTALSAFKKQTREQLTNALDLIYDALDYIDLENNDIKLRPSTVNLRELLQTTLQMLDIATPINVTETGKGINSSSSSINGSGLFLVHTDQAKVTQALVGILRRVKQQIVGIELRVAETVFECFINLTTANSKLLDEPPSGHKDLGVHLAQKICRILGGDVSRNGTQLVITLRDLR